MACQVCTGEAPNNIRYDDAGKSYVFDSPKTTPNWRAVREAVEMCAVLLLKERVLDDLKLMVAGTGYARFVNARFPGSAARKFDEICSKKYGSSEIFCLGEYYASHLQLGEPGRTTKYLTKNK